MLFSHSAYPISWVKPTSLRTSSDIQLSERLDAPTKSLHELESQFLEMQAISMLDAMQQHGVPEIKGVTPSKELILLLKAAAEIEHGLMIQYLYAAYGTTDVDMTTVISGIAIEEMGHLLTVENVLLAMNENPYLGRYDKSNSSFAPFAFSLEPLSALAIAKYAACERPEKSQINAEDLDIYRDIVAELESSATGVVPERVGLLYAKIYWLLRDSDEPLDNPDDEEWRGFLVEEMKEMFSGRHLTTYPVADPVLQGLRADWYASFPSILILTAETRKKARIAIAEISAQGEGFSAGEDGHFERFLAMYKKAQQDANIAKNVPVNPWYQGVPSTGGDEVTAEAAVKLAKLADYLYELVLNYLAFAIHPEQIDQVARSRLARFSLRAMICLRTINRTVQNLPISTAPNAPLFSQCFTLPQGSSEINEIKSRLVVVLQEIRILCAEMVESKFIDLSIASEEILVSLEQAPTEFLT